MVRVRETGLYDKWVQTGILLSFVLNTVNDLKFNFTKQSECMVLDELNIALGPFMSGIIMSIVTFFIELIIWLQIVLSIMKSYLYPMLV